MTPQERGDAKRFNERVKVISGVFANGGLALSGGSISVMYADGAPNWPMSLATLAGIMMIVISVAILGDLRNED